MEGGLWLGMEGNSWRAGLLTSRGSDGSREGGRPGRTSLPDAEARMEWDDKEIQKPETQNAFVDFWFLN